MIYFLKTPCNTKCSALELFFIITQDYLRLCLDVLCSVTELTFFTYTHCRACVSIELSESESNFYFWHWSITLGFINRIVFHFTIISYLSQCLFHNNKILCMSHLWSQLLAINCQRKSHCISTVMNKDKCKRNLPDVVPLSELFITGSI